MFLTPHDLFVLQDYQVEIINTEKRFQQEHMTNWIVDSVTAGITPQQVGVKPQLNDFSYTPVDNLMEDFLNVNSRVVHVFWIILSQFNYDNPGSDKTYTTT